MLFVLDLLFLSGRPSILKSASSCTKQVRLADQARYHHVLTVSFVTLLGSDCQACTAPLLLRKTTSFGRGVAHTHTHTCSSCTVVARKLPSSLPSQTWASAEQPCSPGPDSATVHRPSASCKYFGPRCTVKVGKSTHSSIRTGKLSPKTTRFRHNHSGLVPRTSVAPTSAAT